jgi:GNAT superfamily N-acetyltransferase
MRDRLAFGWEPLAVMLEDGLAEVVAKHWHEVAVHPDKMPLDVDWDGYQDDEDRGILKLMSARKGGHLVGYASYFFLKHRHYRSTCHAINDAIFVDPSVRGLGIRLIRNAERGLADLAKPGWCRIIYHTKVDVEKERGTLSRVFNGLGYETFETCHQKFVRV